MESLIISVALDVKGMILWLLLWSHFPPSQSSTLYIYFSLYFFLYLHLSSPFLSSYLRLSSSVFYFLCRPTLSAKVRWVSAGFHSQNPHCFPKRCLLMTGSYEAEQGTHFKDVSTNVWIGLFCSSTQRHTTSSVFLIYVSDT